jgi:mannose-6-phosphate isomerase-like protein (cupin superfamily)
MSYHVIAPGDLDTLPDRSATTRSISDSVGFSLLGIREYNVEPGEQIPLKYHYHEQQEEALYVLEGTLHVETPDREFRVNPGEFFVVEPGNPHRAHNPKNVSKPVRVIGMGAPSDDSGQPYQP